MPIKIIDGTSPIGSFSDGYQGTWNADTNTPALASGVGTNGYWYAVNVAGATNLDGISDWHIGDIAIFNGNLNAWQQIAGTLSPSEVLAIVEKVNNATGYTLSGGSTTSKTLTITEDSTIDQNLATSASPTHADITLTNQTNHLLSGTNGSGRIVKTSIPNGEIVIGDASANPATVTVSGDGTLSNDGTLNINQSSDSVAGKVELATDAEAIAGTDASRAVTPASFKAGYDSKAADGISPASNDGTGDVGSSLEFAREDHKHPHPTGMTASQIASTPTLPINETDVQSAINELSLATRQIYWDGRNDPTVAAENTAAATLSGNATYNATEDYVRLTDDLNDQSGSLYWEQNQGIYFKVVSEFRIGSSSGADALWLFTHCTSVPIGEAGAYGGYIFAFDEFDGEFQLHFDGVQLATVSGVPWADNQWHRLEFEIAYSFICISLDGVKLLDYQDVNGRNLLGDFIGMGARTGGSSTTHDVRRVEIYRLNNNAFYTSPTDALYTPRNLYAPITEIGTQNTPFGGFGQTNNLLKWSEDFNNAAWSKTNVTVNPNNTIAPNGQQTADQLNWTSTWLGIRQNTLGLVNGNSYNLAVWGKVVNGSGSTLFFDLGDGSPGSITFDTVLKRYDIDLVAGASDWLDIMCPTTSAFVLWGIQLSNENGRPTYSKTTGASVSDSYGLSVDGNLEVIDGGINLGGGITGGSTLIQFFNQSGQPKFGISYIDDTSNNRIFSFGEAITYENIAYSSIPFSTNDSTGNLGLANLYYCTDTSSPRTITLSTSTLNLGDGNNLYMVTIKDTSGGAGAGNITIDTEGSATIDGAPLVAITVNYGVLRLFSDGTNWFTI